MKRKHIDYFDFLRGLAIIFVVFNHSYSADPMSDGLIDMIYLLIRQIVTCAVPIFLAQSAFFLSKKNFVNKSEYFSYLKSHSLRIWIPMVIWSLPLFFIKDHHNYIGSFIYMLIGGYSIYYFIPLIIQFYVLQPVYKRFARNWGVVILFVSMLYMLPLIIISSLSKGLDSVCFLNALLLSCGLYILLLAITLVLTDVTTNYGHGICWLLHRCV